MSDKPASPSVSLALSTYLEYDGNATAANIATIATVIINSINVNPRRADMDPSVGASLESGPLCKHRQPTNGP